MVANPSVFVSSVFIFTLLMSDPSCSPSPSKKRKSPPIVISSDGLSDMYVLYVLSFLLLISLFCREVIKGPVTPVKKRMRKTPPGSDAFKLFDAVTTTYVCLLIP